MDAKRIGRTSGWRQSARGRVLHCQYQVEQMSHWHRIGGAVGADTVLATVRQWLGFYQPQLHGFGTHLSAEAGVHHAALPTTKWNG